VIEKDIEPAVRSWLKGRNLMIAHEVMMGGYCDLVGFRFGSRPGRRIPSLDLIVAVELKIRDIAGALYQARTNRSAHESWVAMPAEKCYKMRQASVHSFIDEGIGLLSVDGDAVRVCVEPEFRPDAGSVRLRTNLWRWKKRLDRICTQEAKLP